jgi:HK97 family phage prohead protease
MSERELRRAQRLSMVKIDERLSLSFARGGVEMRAKPNGTAAGSSFEWTGYAAVYDQDFPMWDRLGEPYTESVAQGACKRSLANPNIDVPFVFGHSEWGIPFARTKSGTMQLAEDSRGLHVHVPSMDGRREEVRALASAVERGDVSEMSLAFICNRQEWDDTFEHRTVAEMDLHRGDVSAVIHGANPATDGASMFPVEQLMFRRPAAIGGPHLLGRERRMPTAPYTVHANEDNACPQCQSRNDRDAYFCDQCGAAMPGGPVGEAAAEMGGDETQQCQSCLCMNATDAKYCDQCGRELAGVIAYRGPGGVYALDYSDGRPREQLSVTQAERDKATAAGNSLPDGSYPVNNVKQLKAAAVLAASHHGDWKAAQALIRRRAKELGVDVTTLPGFGEAKADGRPLELRASAAEDMNLASSSDYDAAAAGHAAGLTCPQCKTGNHGGAKFCNQCGHNFATGATVAVDDSSGIPGEEVQMAAARKLEIMSRELELEELAAAR